MTVIDIGWLIFKLSSMAIEDAQRSKYKIEAKKKKKKNERKRRNKR